MIKTKCEQCMVVDKNMGNDHLCSKQSTLLQKKVVLETALMGLKDLSEGKYCFVYHSADTI